MIKTALASFILTTAPAMAIDLETNVNALVNMSFGGFYCGLQIPPEPAYLILQSVARDTGTTEAAMAYAVDQKAHEIAANMTDTNIKFYCQEIKARYKRAGFNNY